MATAPSWITFDKISGTGNATVQVKAIGNMFTGLRTGSFSVKTTDEKIERIVKVQQDPFKTTVTTTVTVEHSSMGSPSEGWFEAQYTIRAKANGPVYSDVTITVKLDADTSFNHGVTIPKGDSSASEDNIILGNSSGMFSDRFDIVSYSPHSDLYHDYVVK